MVAMERRLAVGVQVETELVDKHSDDTIDKKEQPRTKELMDVADLLKPKQINIKREIPDLDNSYEIDGTNSRLVYGARVRGHNTNPNSNLKHSTLHKNVNQSETSFVIQTFDTKFYDVIQEETETADKMSSETERLEIKEFE